VAGQQDFDNNIKPNWCLGCGDYAVLNSLRRAVANVGIEPHNLAVVSGIGCSGRFSGYMYAYGFHSIHGRSLPVAQGIKLANRDLTVVACGGDGDGYAIGIGHTIHAIRRNLDITYIVMDNHIYGLTKGQTSPRSDLGFKTKTSPSGSIETPVSVLAMALAAGATFVAQGYSRDLNELTALIEQGIQHSGFSLINIFSPCVTFNKVNTYEWFSEHLTGVKSISGYDPGSRAVAMETIMAHDGLVTGLLYQDRSKAAYQDLLTGYSKKPLAYVGLELEQAEFERLTAEFY
jgi:2-oxoglutarate ferredoxin oxidoreductase subunit beta